MQSITSNQYSYNLPVKKHKAVVNYLVTSVPIILIFDWLLNLEVINLQIGLILKGVSVVIFGQLLVFKKHKIIGFKFKKLLLYFIYLNFIYALLSENPIENVYYSVRILYWVLGSLSFYYLFSNEFLSVVKFRKMILATILIASLFTISLMIGSEEHQNASAYLILWCLPILFLFKQTTIVKILKLIAIISIILTVKRGAMLALFVSLVFYFIGLLRISKLVINKIKIIVGGIFVFGFSFLILFLIWAKIAIRLEDKGGSGRDVMYEGIFSRYINSDITELVFGYGINSVQKFTATFLAKNSKSVGIAAHSDWLQYMHDFGVFGILFMVLLHYFFIKLVRFHYKNKTNIYPTVLMSYSIFLLTTIYSFILNTPDAIFFGIIIALISIETRKIKFLNQYA